MADIVPFSSAQLPAYLKNRKELSAINKDVMTAAAYPTLSIKGKVFTLVKDNERKILMNPNDQDEVAQSIQLNVLRANPKTRVYFSGSYIEGESDNTRPTCQSDDGIAPRADAEEPQAKKCSICPHAVWGSRTNDDGSPGKGTECSVNTRLAVTAPDNLDMPFLLRVPAGSKKNYSDAVKMADARGLPYNALVLKVSFDPTAPAPKLVFKPVGLLSDEDFEKANAKYDSDLVKDIVGLGRSEPAAAPAAAVDSDELDAAIAAKAVVKQAAAPKPAPAPARVTIEEVVQAAAPAPVTQAKVTPTPENYLTAAKTMTTKPKAPPPAAAPQGVDDIMSELSNLLDMPDD